MGFQAQLSHSDMGLRGLGHWSHQPTLFHWWDRWGPHADLTPEALLQRMHPHLREEIFKRPMLKKQFEDDLRTVFTAYKKQGSVEELRDLVNENLEDLNQRIESEGPEHMSKLLEHLKHYSQFQGIAYPLLLVPKTSSSLLLLPFSLNGGSILSKRRRTELSEFL